MRKLKTSLKAAFNPRPRLLYVVWEDLIKDEMAGVIELVKNAYDADATRVRIAFENIDDTEDSQESDKGEGVLVIEDNGHGMTRRVLLENWMSPATDSKERDETSPRGRPMLGRKGVGRFSAMRLGSEMKIQTIPIRTKVTTEEDLIDIGNQIELSINWQDFQTSSCFLSDIEIDVEIFEHDEPIEQGTRLEISDLRDRWDDNRLKRLYRELRLLLSPLPVKEDVNNFTVYLDLERSGLDPATVRGLSKKIQPYSIPEVADYRAQFTVAANGEYTFSYQRLLYSEKDSEELHETKDGIDIRNLFSDADLRDDPQGGTSGNPLPCGPLDMTFYIWDRDIKLLELKAARIQETEKLTISKVRKLLNEISGVGIYRDGFRVRPYGEQDVDWLNLGQRRVQRYGEHIGPNQILGLVNISSIENPKLDDRASREGLKENRAYRVLQACILAALGWVEPMRYRFRQRNGLGRPAPKSTAAIVSERRKRFQELTDHVDAVLDDPEKNKKTKELIKAAEEVSEKEHARLSEQAIILQDMHALGLLARYVVHEGRNLDSALDSALNNMERISRGSPGLLPDSLLITGDNLGVFESSIISVRGIEKRLDGLLDDLDPLTRPRRTRRPKVTVEEVINKVLELLKPDIDKYGIEVSMPAKRHEVLAWDRDIFLAIHNLLVNSIFWIQKTQNPRKIRIEIAASRRPMQDGMIDIIITDTGPGVKAVDESYIFDLGYTTKSDGYGVGLFIAREAVERSKGMIELVNPGENGAKFLIALERA